MPGLHGKRPMVPGRSRAGRPEEPGGAGPAQELAHLYSLAAVQFWATWLHYRRRDVLAVQAQAEALLTLATTHGFALHVGLAPAGGGGHWPCRARAR